MPLSKLRSGILPTSSSKKSQADKTTSSQLTLTSTGSSGKQTPSPSSSPLSSLRRPYTRTSSNQSSTAASLARRTSLPESDGNSHPSSMADAPPLHTMETTQKARKASTRSPGLRKAQSAHSLLAQYQQQSSDHRDVSPRTKIPLPSRAQTRCDPTALASAMPRRLVDEFDTPVSSNAGHRSFDGALPARNKGLDAAASPPTLPRSPGSTDLRSKRRGLIQPPLPPTLSSSSNIGQQSTNSKPLVLVTAGEETVPSTTKRVSHHQVDTLGDRSQPTDAPRPVEPSRNRSSSTSSNSDKEYHQHVVLTARVERLGVSNPKTMVLSKMTSQSNFSMFKTAATSSRDQPSHSVHPPLSGSELPNASGSVSTPSSRTPSTAQPLTRTALARQLVAERARLRESMQKVPLEVLRDRVLGMDRVEQPARHETSSTDVSYDSSIQAHAGDAVDIDEYEVTQSAPGSPDSLLSTFSGALARTSRYSRPSARLPREVATSDCSTASSTMSHLRLPAGATLAPSLGDTAGHRALRASASSDALNPRTSAAVKQSIHSRLRLLHPSDSSPALPMGSLAEAHNEELLFDVHPDYSPLRTPMTATAFTADQLVQTPSRAMFPSAYKDKRPPSDEPFSGLLQQDEAHSISHDGQGMSDSTSSASVGRQPVDNADQKFGAPSRSLSIPELSCVDARPSVSASKDEAQQGYLSRLLTRSTNLKTVDNDTSQPAGRKPAPRSRSRPASKQSLLTTLGSKTFGQASRRQGVAISEPRLTSHTSLPPAVTPSLGAEAPSFDPSHSHSCPSLATQTMAQSDSNSSLQSSGLVPSRTTTVPSLPDTSVDSGYQLSSPNSSMRSTRNRWWNKMARRSSIARADPPPSLNLNLGNSTRLSREVSAELQYTDWSPSSPSPQTFAQRITKSYLPSASQESRQVSHHHSKSTPEVDVKPTKRTRNATGGARLE